MTYYNKLKKFNISDLQWIHYQIFNKHTKSSKKDIINKLIQPLEKNRNMLQNKGNFLYNPTDPDSSYDVYIDKNPYDTISIKYITVQDVKNTIQKLEKLYKSNRYSHKRIWQVAMIMKIRLQAIVKNYNKGLDRYKISENYYNFLKKRTKLSEKDRKSFNFTINKKYN